MKNFKGPRKHSLQLLFIGIVIIGAACLLTYTLFLYFGLFSRMEQPKPTRLSNLMASNSTTLGAHPQSFTLLHSPVRSVQLLPNAGNNSHGVKPAKVYVNSQARNGFQPAFIFTSITDMHKDKKASHLTHYIPTHKQQHSNEPRKYELQKKDPEADRVDASEAAANEPLNVGEVLGGDGVSKYEKHMSMYEMIGKENINGSV